MSNKNQLPGISTHQLILHLTRHILNGYSPERFERKLIASQNVISLLNQMHLGIELNLRMIYGMECAVNDIKMYTINIHTLAQS